MIQVEGVVRYQVRLIRPKDWMELSPRWSISPHALVEAGQTRSLFVSI